MWIVCFTRMLLYVAGQPTQTGGESEYRSPDPPINEQEWVHPIIFEHQDKIRLTRSYYKLTAFLDFTPFLASFQSVWNYLTEFEKDISPPRYHFKFSQIMSSSLKTSLVANETVLKNYLKQQWCQHDPYWCNMEIKIEHVKVEMKYLDKVFNASFDGHQPLRLSSHLWQWG